MIKPRKHQSIALEKTLSHLINNDRGKIIHPTGTGKSILQVLIANELNYSKILQVVPNLELQKQMQEDWVKHSGYNVVFNNKDVKTVECQDGMVIISTYQSLDKITGDFDLIMFDEAHRTTVQEDALFSYGLHDKNIKSKKRLFFTATERFFGDNDEVLSMSDESVYGKTIDELKFVDAVNEGIITDFDVVVGISYEDCDNYTRSIRESISEGVINDLREKGSIKKCITYHSTVKNALDFSSRFDKGHHINGETKNKTDIIKSFSSSEGGVMTNCQALVEGINIPTLDSVCFVDRTKSKIRIQQAIGRVVRISEGKDRALVVIPVLKHHVDKGVNSKDLVNVLKSIRSLRNDELRVHVFNVRSESESTGITKDNEDEFLGDVLTRVKSCIVNIDRMLIQKASYEEHLEFAIENKLKTTTSWENFKTPPMFVKKPYYYFSSSFFKEVRALCNPLELKDYISHAIDKSIYNKRAWKYRRDRKFVLFPSKEFDVDFFRIVRDNACVNKLGIFNKEKHINIALKYRIYRNRDWIEKYKKGELKGFYMSPDNYFKGFFKVVEKKGGVFVEKESFSSHFNLAVKNNLTSVNKFSSYTLESEYFKRPVSVFKDVDFFKKVREEVARLNNN